MSSSNPRLFVYGTLRKGFSLHDCLQESEVRFMGFGRISGYLYDLGEFPGATPTSSEAAIEGEVYELLGGEPQLRMLDTLEEFLPESPEKSLFIRRLTAVTMRDGKRLHAWAYFVAKVPPEARLVLSGDYTEVRRTR